MRGTCNSDPNTGCNGSSNANTKAVTTAARLFLWLKSGELWKWAIPNLCKISIVCDTVPNSGMFGWSGWVDFFLRHSGLYISKLELAIWLYWEALYGWSSCVTIFQPEEYEFLQNNARSPDFSKSVNTFLFLYVVKKGPPPPPFNCCLFLTEYVRFICLYFLYRFERKPPLCFIGFLIC